MCSIERDISSDLDGPQPIFQGHDIFEVECLKNDAFRAKLLKNTNMKPYTIYRMIPLS